MTIDEILGTETKVVLIPAYGRKYDTAQDMMNAWHNGFDFKILRGPYCSVRDVEKLSSDYDKLILLNLNGDMSQVELQFGLSVLK